MMTDALEHVPQLSHGSLALLIDGDNVPVRLIPFLLAKAGKWGEISIRRVYGDWTSPHMNTWRTMLSPYGLRAIYHAQPRKNGTDIALTVDAMDLFARGVRCFCLCTGDSDSIPLVLWLREQGCMVMVLSQGPIPLALQRCCSPCFSSDDLCLPEQRTEALQERSEHLPATGTPALRKQRRQRPRGRKTHPRLLSSAEKEQERRS